MRPRIKSIKTEKVTTSSNHGRITIGRPEVKFRKDSVFLPNELPIVISAGLMFNLK